MIYLDNAATTYPKPASVCDMMRIAPYRYGANPGRGGYKMSMETSEAIYDTRKLISKMFNAPGAENVIFTSNCTSALNMAIKGLARRNGTAVTSCLEHNSVMRPLYKLKKTGFQDYRQALKGKTHPETVRNFEYLLRGNISYIISTCASNVFGDIMPLRELGKLAGYYKIPFIVDGAQGGGIIDIDMKRDNISCLCLPGHKGLYGVAGTGILVLGENIRPETLLEGGTGSSSLEADQPRFLPDRYESGTVNIPGIVSLKKGVEFVMNTGICNIRSHEEKLVSRLYDFLSGDKRFTVYNDYGNGEYAPLLSFNIKGINSEEAAEILSGYGIAVRGGFHCNYSAHDFYKTADTGTIRVSPSFFNNMNEINFLINSLNKIAKA